MDWGSLLGGLLGGLIGAIGTGWAVVLTAKKTAAASRTERSKSAAAEILSIVHNCGSMLEELRRSPSKLTMGANAQVRRLMVAKPLIAELERANVVLAPLLGNEELRSRLFDLWEQCEHIPDLEDEELREKVIDAQQLCFYVQESLDAFLSDQPLPD